MVINHKVKPHEVEEYLRTRLGASTAVKQVGKDLQAMVNEWYSWAMAEIQSLRQELEEKDIELMLTENKIMPEWKQEAAAAALNIKRRTNFNAEDSY